MCHPHRVVGFIETFTMLNDVRSRVVTHVKKARLLCCCCRYPFTPDQTIPECDWEVFLRETASMIVEEQTPKK